MQRIELHHILMEQALVKYAKQNKYNQSKYKMINFDNYTNENKIEHNLKWPYIPDHPYRMLIEGGSGSGKTNALLNLINNQSDIDKIYLYAKDPMKQNINI